MAAKCKFWPFDDIICSKQSQKVPACFVFSIKKSNSALLAIVELGLLSTVQIWSSVIWSCKTSNVVSKLVGKDWRISSYCVFVKFKTKINTSA